MSPFKTFPVGIRAWIPVLFLCAACAAAIAAGHDGRRAWQMMLLALPMLLWLCWAVVGPAWRRVRAVVAFAALAGFLIDGALRAFLQHQYQAAPDSTLVLGAIATVLWRRGLRRYRKRGQRRASAVKPSGPVLRSFGAIPPCSRVRAGASTDDLRRARTPADPIRTRPTVPPPTSASTFRST